MAQVAVIQIVNLFGLWYSSSQMINVFVHITHHYILVGLFLPLLPTPTVQNAHSGFFHGTRRQLKMMLTQIFFNVHALAF